MPVHTVGGLFLADLVVALLARSDARDGAGFAGEPNLHIAGLSPASTPVGT